MRIIISSAGAQSDLMFLFALAKELQQRNHVVTLVVPEKYRSQIMKMEVRMVTCGRSFDEYLEGNPGEHQDKLAKGLASQVASQFVSLRDALRESDAFVSGTFVIPAASMAEKLNLPFFQVIQSPLLLDPDQFPSQGISKEKSKGLLGGRRMAALRDEWKDLIGKVLNKERSFAHQEPVSDLYDQLYAYGHQIVAVDQEFSEVQKTSNRSVVGYFDFESFNQQLPGLREGKQAIFLGPLHLNQIDREPFLRELSLALSNPEYQLIVRSDWIGGQDKQLPENCLAIDPLLEPSAIVQASAVIHQGAGGYVMACARKGIPQVIVPLLTDQLFWADRVAALKLGPAPLDKIDAKTVAAALMQALKMSESSIAFAERKRDQNGIVAAADVIELISREKITG